MRHGSLFSGIGGFDLAAEWMGWENVFHCEMNEFGKKVLKHYWPQAISYHDITKTDFTIHRGRIDILTGGFPCQPYSLAGKRLGKEDNRHLWPEMLRAIREIQPTWVVGENVFGLVNWDGGLVFDEVQTDLEAQGYEVQPYVLPACAVNAPHRRDRVWFVAYRNAEQRKCKEKRFQPQFKNGGRKTTPNPNSDGLNGSNSEHEINTSQGGEYALNDIDKATMHTNCTSEQGKHIRQTREGKFNGPDSGDGFDNFQNFPTQSPICVGNDGISERLDGITFPKWRNESIKAAGNAVVPQVVYQIFKAIEEYDRNRS